MIPDVLQMVQFEPGSCYADYVPGADEVAAYCIGGLIAGKVLAKAGLLAALVVFLRRAGSWLRWALAACCGWSGAGTGRRHERLGSRSAIATQKSLTSAGHVAHKVVARLAGPGEARSFSGCCCDGTTPETKIGLRQA
jgi:Protein of unknown function (DUF2167)